MKYYNRHGLILNPSQQPKFLQWRWKLNVHENAYEQLSFWCTKPMSWFGLIIDDESTTTDGNAKITFIYPRGEKAAMGLLQGHPIGSYLAWRAVLLCMYCEVRMHACMHHIG